MKKRYKVHKFTRTVLERIKLANEILQEYQDEGMVVNLRQLYYRMVTRNIIPNTFQEYKKIGDTIANARMAGLIDWDFIEDRHRTVYGGGHNDDLSNIFDGIEFGYAPDLWKDQYNYAEVWIEKDSLSGMLQRACPPWDVNYFACKGYPSITVFYETCRRILYKCSAQFNGGKARTPVIIHLGDHDPSGIDMTRNIFENLRLFLDVHGSPPPHIERVALNKDQVDQYDLPPNPAKLTDPRIGGYMELFGEESWELDGIEPRTMIEIIEDNIKAFCDVTMFNAAVAAREEVRKEIKFIGDQYPTIQELMQSGDVREYIADPDFVPFVTAAVARKELIARVSDYPQLVARTLGSPGFVKNALDEQELVEETIDEWEEIKWLL